jgi:hypothetical protein
MRHSMWEQCSHAPGFLAVELYEIGLTLQCPFPSRERLTSSGSPQGVPKNKVHRCPATEQRSSKSFYTLFSPLLAIPQRKARGHT